MSSSTIRTLNTALIAVLALVAALSFSVSSVSAAPPFTGKTIGNVEDCDRAGIRRFCADLVTIENDAEVERVAIYIERSIFQNSLSAGVVTNIKAPRLFLSGTFTAQGASWRWGYR